MLSEQDRRSAREFNERVKKVARVLDLRVFGSRARGEAEPDADMDVFVELETYTPELRQRISEIAWEVGFEMDRIITTVVTARYELGHGAMGANPLYLNVEKEGVRP